MIGVYLNTEEAGIIKVTKFSKESNAEEAGMAVEDKIIGLDGNILESYGELKNILMDKKPGESVEVKVQRKSLFLSDRILEFTVELK
jgi:predicted metalloprotease with PDZ domain